ncbi:MAG: RecX family transcriptional regulator [Sphingobium sp.]
MSRSPPRKARPPLDDDRLRELALRYVGRFATTRARLLTYLARKVRERGWSSEEPPAFEVLADRLVELGYINDASYAVMKGAAMARRGLGPRRIRAGLQADGVGETERAEADEQALAAKWDAANALARRKRIGPYALVRADPATYQRQIAAFVRAGHDFSTARRWVEAAPGQMPEASE